MTEYHPIHQFGAHKIVE